MPLAMVFGGGGARGAFQAGAYAALAQPGLTPRFMLGTSIGAINALAATKLAGPQLGQWWLTKLPTRMFALGGELPFVPVLKELIHLPRRQAWPVLAVTATKRTRRPHVVTLNQPPAEQLQWLLATTAIPGVYPPVTIAGQRYVDGAVCDELPVDLAYDLGATTVIAIEAGGIGARSTRIADFTIKIPPQMPGILDFRRQGRAMMLTCGWQAGQKLLKSPEFQAWRAEQA